MTGAQRPLCYACGHEYVYLGRGHHPGRCPRCSSGCVSPAGELAVVATVDVSPPSEPPRVTVLAIDDRHRQFLYHFGSGDEPADLVALQVEGQLVRPTDAERPIPIPDPVRRACVEHDRPDRDRSADERPSRS
ncbi:MAG: hypothetical protein QXG03_13765 [Halalkalicoccus sp.]